MVSTQQSVKDPSVVVSSAGVFHAHQIGLAAAEGNMLKRFIYSALGTRTDGLPKPVIKRQLPSAAVSFLSQYLKSPSHLAQAYWLGDSLHDRLASRYAADGDIFHYFNHQGLASAKRAKQLGKISICERSSAHPSHQQQMLVEEFALHGLTYPAVYDKLVARHEEEYEVSDYIMVCSEYVERSMLEQGTPPEKLIRTTLGFDPTRFQPGKKTDNVFRVIAAGALSLRKGTQYLLEGFKRANIPNSELLFVGNPQPEILPTLEKYAGLFKHERFVRHEKLQSFYHASDVFVLPSIDEGFGMVILEAAACKLPVVISENVGAPFAHDQHGRVVPIRDPQAIADALVLLYENPQLREQYAAQAYAHAQQFTWARYRQEVRDAYAQIWQNAR